MVVSQFPDDAPYTAEIVDELQRHPDLEVVLPAFGSAGPDSCASAESVVEQICRAIGVTTD